MRKFVFKFVSAIALALSICACGPREIGEGSSYESPLAPEATGADMLRLPMTGMNNNQKLLYWFNRPDVMASMQRCRMERMRKAMGLAPEPESPEYRATPRQRSPFRQ